MSTGKDWQRYEDWHTKQMQLEAVIADLQLNLQDATKRADDAERERDAAMAVLREVEHESVDRIGRPCCVYCGSLKGDPHCSNCALAACLNGGA